MFLLFRTFFFPFGDCTSDTNQAQKRGTDVLLDLLSIGTPPAQSNSSIPDMVSPSQDSKSAINVLEKLSSPSAPAGGVSTPPGSSSMMDLLDGFAPNPSKPGMVFISRHNSLELLLLLFFPSNIISPVYCDRKQWSSLSFNCCI